MASLAMTMLNGGTMRAAKPKNCHCELRQGGVWRGNLKIEQISI